MDHQYLIMIFVFYYCSAAMSLSMSIQSRQLNTVMKLKGTDTIVQDPDNSNDTITENVQLSTTELFTDESKTTSSLLINSSKTNSFEESSETILNTSEVFQNKESFTDSLQNETSESENLATSKTTSSPISRMTSITNLEKPKIKQAPVLSKTSLTENNLSNEKVPIMVSVPRIISTTASSIMVTKLIESFSSNQKISSIVKTTTSDHRKQFKSTISSNEILSNTVTTQTTPSVLDIPLSISIILSDEYSNSNTNTDLSSSTSKTFIPIKNTKVPLEFHKDKKFITFNSVKEINRNNDKELQSKRKISSLPFRFQKSKDNQIENKFKKISSLINVQTSTEGHITTIRAPWKTRFQSFNKNTFDKVCDLPKDEGYGSDRYSMWYFNKMNGKCEWFNYLSNGGNGNRFHYRANCENSCIENFENMCLRLDIITCKEIWLKCKMESHLECHQKAIRAGQDVQLTCPPKQPICIHIESGIRKSPIFLTHQSLIPNDCKLPKDPGYCEKDSNSLLVYYYNPEINDCLGFLYSNCGGNLNRFSTKADCMNRCAI